ncbi:MAG: type II secretion system F family protein [Pseudomonadales bacterium]|nr:type II secretion system F family protein [Pseudomonadales bacterium]
MANYKYKAIDQKGKMQRGHLRAKNELEAAFRLENKGYDLVSLSVQSYNRLRIGRSVITRRELINMVFHLEQLTKSGIPLIEGLSDLRDSAENGYFHDVMVGLVEEIESGLTFSEGLAQFPQDFDTVFVALIEVGEESGELPQVLKQMGDSLRWSDELIAKTQQVLMYPVIVAVVVLSVTVFMMVYLVPKIIPFVEEMGGQIPGHTAVLIAVSDFFVGYWWTLLVIPIGIITFFKLLGKMKPEVRLAVDRFIISIPIFGTISFKIKLARLATYMAVLYSAGITVLRSLEICETLMGNLYMAQSIRNTRMLIAEGNTISEGFTRSKMFPPLVIRMIKVGESTGNLDEAMMNVSYFYDREVQDAIDTIEPAINPLLTVFMGTMLGWIMLSVLGPVWDAVATIG